MNDSLTPPSTTYKGNLKEDLFENISSQHVKGTKGVPSGVCCELAGGRAPASEVESPDLVLLPGNLPRNVTDMGGH